MYHGFSFKSTASLGGKSNPPGVEHAVAVHTDMDEQQHICRMALDGCWSEFKWLQRKGTCLEDPLQMLFDRAGGERSANTVLLSVQGRMLRLSNISQNILPTANAPEAINRGIWHAISSQSSCREVCLWQTHVFLLQTALPGWLIRDLRSGRNPLVPHRPAAAGVPLLAARAIAQALGQSSGSARNTPNMTACQGGNRTMYSLRHSGSRWASPRGNIRGKSSGRRRRARPWQRPPGLRERCQRRRRPEPEPGHKQLLQPAGRRAGPARQRGGPRASRAPALPGGTGGLLLTRYRLLSPLGLFPDRTSRWKSKCWCRSPFAAEGRGSARSGCVGDSRGQIPSPGAGAGRA